MVSSLLHTTARAVKWKTSTSQKQVREAKRSMSFTCFPVCTKTWRWRTEETIHWISAGSVPRPLSRHCSESRGQLQAGPDWRQTSSGGWHFKAIKYYFLIYWLSVGEAWYLLNLGNIIFFHKLFMNVLLLRSWSVYYHIYKKWLLAQCRVIK